MKSYAIPHSPFTGALAIVTPDRGKVDVTEKMYPFGYRNLRTASAQVGAKRLPLIALVGSPSATPNVPKGATRADSTTGVQATPGRPRLLYFE